MSQQVEELAAKLEDLSSIPRTHVGKRRTDSSMLSFDLHACTVECAHAHKGRGKKLPTVVCACHSSTLDQGGQGSEIPESHGQNEAV